MKKYLLLSLILTLVLVGCEKPTTQNPLITEDEKIIGDEELEIVENAKNEEEESMKKLEESVELAFDLDELKDKKETNVTSRGSCDLIAEASTCIEYIGSFWTDQQMRLHCESTGIFSKDPCPSGMVGGCNIGEGVISDMITWFYLQGGGGITEVSLKHAENACNATMMSRWVNAK